MSKEKFQKRRFLDTLGTFEKVSFEDILEDDKPIIFDTNFLFITFEFRIDLIAELERLIGTSYSLYIYEGTLDELQNIEDKGDKNKKFLPLIQSMLKIYNFKIIQSEKSYVDDQILENAHKGILIATNDSGLRKKLWDVPCRVLFMRQKQYLEIR